ncbi:C-terminal binding protein [Chloroflexota bacterium]
MAHKVILTFNVGPTDSEEKALSEVGAELIKPDWKNEDDLVKACSDNDVIAMLIGPNAPVTKRVIDAMPNLKILSRLGIGIDNIAIDSATARGIPVSVVLDYCISEVADHAMAFILAFARRIIPLSEAVKAGHWTRERSDIPKVRTPMSRLSEVTLGVVGTGRIGGSLVARAKAFGMRAIAYDPYLPREAAEKLGVELVDFDQLLNESDFISLHAPLTKETTHLFSGEAFSKMKRTAYLINNARGGLVDEQALYTALKEGQIAGAGLDVTDPEPPEADNPLLSLDNAFITGHASWYSEEAVAELRWKGVMAVIEFLKGGWPVSLANPEVKNART